MSLPVILQTESYKSATKALLPRTKCMSDGKFRVLLLSIHWT